MKESKVKGPYLRKVIRESPCRNVTCKLKHQGQEETSSLKTQEEKFSRQNRMYKNPVVETHLLII